MLRRFGARVSAFLIKESVVAWGQPRLLLGLIIGPFILLLLFGMGFTGRPSRYEVLLVVPDRAAVPSETAAYRRFFLWSLRLVDVTTNDISALRRLNRGEVDVVIVAPEDPLRALAQDQPALFEVYFNKLDPLDRAKINSLVYGHTRELNTLLVAAMLDAILEAAGVQDSNDPALVELRGRLFAGDSEGALGVIDRLLAAVVILRLTGEGVYQVASERPTTAPTTPPLERFEVLLRALRTEVDDEPGLTAEQEAQFSELEQTALLLPDVIRVAARISPQRLAAPVDYRLTNLAPTGTSVVNYAAPVVVALLIQHIAITLVSLSVIRERTRGTIELFAVAPIRITEIITGKALSFAILIGALATGLVAVVVMLLRVPFAGDILLAAITLALLIAVSLSIGFIIAAVSTTEPQTVQLAMLTLLFAIFFGGLFVPVESVEMPVRLVSEIVPITHAGAALREVMLRGRDVPVDPLLSLLIMAVVLVPVAYLTMRRSYRPY